MNRRLLRETWRHRGQVVSIASVVAVAVMTVLTMRGTYDSLTLSRDLYYQDTRFPHVWASLKRSPESVRLKLAEIPGVSAVTTRIALTATIDAPKADLPALGRFYSVESDRQSTLSDIHLVSGRFVEAGSRDEVLLSVKFAAANGLAPGDVLPAVIHGRLRDLRIVGTAISPEHTYAVPPGALYPDDVRYGIVWMDRSELGALYDMEGAFNEVLLQISPAANIPAILAEVDRILAPHGGLGAYPRALQASHLMLQAELDGNRTTGTAIPAVFLLVAAFLLNIVLGRMIATQRSEIAVMKAFGYSDREVGLHYLLFALNAVLLGTVIGGFAGVALGQSMVNLYGEFFDFPTLQYRMGPHLLLIAVGVSGLAAIVGAGAAVRRAVKLPPAEAMRPEAPARFTPGMFERWGLSAILPAAGRMILRNVERTPLRSALATIGVSFAVAILVVGMFMFDGVDLMVRLQFGEIQREDLAVTFNRPVAPSAAYELGQLDGVGRVETFRTVPARLHSGHRRRDIGIMGIEPDAKLRHIVDQTGRRQPLPPEGLVVSGLLADQLQAGVGDRLLVELLDGRRSLRELPVAGVVEDFMGLSVYMDLEALERLTGSTTVNGAFLSTDRLEPDALNARIKRVPAIASVTSPSQALASFQKQMDEGMMISIFFILGFSSIIALAVIYNGARVSLSERGRELASLRVLGFSRREVAILLLGEQALTTAVAIPLGWMIGYALAAAIALGMRTEAYRIPLVVSPSTFAMAAFLTIVAGLASGLIVRRRLDRMDLVEVLKTRE